MKTTMKKFFISSIIMAISIIFIFLVTPKNANADASSIAGKWINTMFAQCLNAGPNSPISSETSSPVIAEAVFSGKGSQMKMPTFDYLGLGVDSVNCVQVLQGTSSITGVFPANGISADAGWDIGVDRTLYKMGYKESATEEVYEFKINVVEKSAGYRQFYNEDDNGVRTLGSKTYTTEVQEQTDSSTKITAKRNTSDNKLYYSFSPWSNHWANAIHISLGNGKFTMNVANGCNVFGGTIIGNGESSGESITVDLKNNITEFYNQFDSINNAITINCRTYDDGAIVEGIEYTYNFGTSEVPILDTGKGGEFTYSSNTSTVLSNFGMTISDLTEDEKYDLYVFYLNHALNVTTTNRVSCEQQDGLAEVHLKDDSGTWKVYYANLGSKTADEFAIKENQSITTKNLDYIIAWLNSHPAEKLTEEEVEECKETGEGLPSDMSIDKITPNRTGGDEMDDQPCFDGGVGSLGWIICPIIKLLRQTTENLYDYVITPFLEIDVGAFDTSSAMFQGWQTFQSFANIVFVIILILVILSQVTGYGIDNYGIKRMLPKIIVGAILVNLSFIICQLLVDISNIVGFSMENMFDNLASQAMSNAGGAAVGNNGTAIGATIISGAVGIGGAAAAIYTAEIWLPVIILPLLLGLISIIISCLFMFIILGARRAVAIILVVISPLAFVMYMLPNTRKLFDRWMSAVKAVLVLFPICGLLMGGGAFAGAILWNVSGDFFLGQLLAALTTVIPFFFIPRILKSSLNAVGNLGTTLSNIGNGISRGLGGITKGAVGNSNWYNNMQNNRKDILEERNRNREQERAQRIVDNLRGRQSRGETLSDRQTRRLARYQQRVLAGIKEQGDVDRLSSPEYAAAANTKIQNELEEAQIATEQSQVEASAAFVGGDYNSVANEMVDLMRSDTNGSNSARIKALQNALNKVGDDGRTAMDNAMTGMDFSSISKEARQAWASNAMSQHAAEWKNNARSLFEAAKANTGASASGNYNDFVPGGTSAAKITSYRPEQFANMDDGQFEHLMKEYRGYQRTLSTGGTLSADQQARLDGMQNIAAEVMSNPNLQGALKGQRAADVASMAGNVLNVRANQQADARASAQWRGVTDADLQNIVTDSRSTPQERAQAQAEINRRSGSSSP